jgi:GTP-binding protein
VREVEAELKGYGDALWAKPRLLVINKIDALSADALAELQAEAGQLGLPVYAISAVSGEGIPTLLRELYAQVLEQRRQHAPLSTLSDEEDEG